MEQPDDRSIRICSNHSLPDGEKRFSKMGIPCTACSGKFLYVRNFFLYLKCKDRIRTSMNVAYIIAAILTAVYAVGVYMLGRKYAAKHTEE